MSFYAGFEKKSEDSGMLKAKNYVRTSIGLKPAKATPKYFRGKYVDPKHRKLLNKGIKNNYKGKETSYSIKYKKANGDVVDRQFTPYTAKNKNLLVGFDHHRGEIRSYRADRILSLTGG